MSCTAVTLPDRKAGDTAAMFAGVKKIIRLPTLNRPVGYVYKAPANGPLPAVNEKLTGGKCHPFRRYMSYSPAVNAPHSGGL